MDQQYQQYYQMTSVQPTPFDGVLDPAMANMLIQVWISLFLLIFHPDGLFVGQAYSIHVFDGCIFFDTCRFYRINIFFFNNASLLIAIFPISHLNVSTSKKFFFPGNLSLAIVLWSCIYSSPHISLPLWVCLIFCLPSSHLNRCPTGTLSIRLLLPVVVFLSFSACFFHNLLSLLLRPSLQAVYSPLLTLVHCIPPRHCLFMEWRGGRKGETGNYFNAYKYRFNQLFL